jgi:LacI family transcriptional regulator
MKPNAGIRGVAEQAGVSVGTVSKVLNHPETVSPKTLLKVRNTMAALGFVRNDLARQLRMGRGDAIGLVVVNVANPFFADLAHSLEAAAEKLGRTVVIGSSDQDGAREERYVDLFEEQRVRGVLIAPLNGLTPRLSRLRDTGTPVILFDPNIESDQVCSVALDGNAGGYVAARHLIETGRKRIIFAGGPISQVAERFTGASKAARETPGVTLTLFETSDLTVAEGRSVAAHILTLPATDRPDAIFAANDLLAIGILQELILARDVLVPDDIALVGYDDIDFAASTIVPLTTIRQPLDLLAITALRLLEEEASNMVEHKHGRTLLQPELIIRESTNLVGLRR